MLTQWTPSNGGMKGNDWADFLAKKGTLIAQLKIINIPFCSLKPIIPTQNRSLLQKGK